MAAAILPIFFFFFSMFFSSSFAVFDYQALLNFKKSLNNTQALDSWDPSNPPCSNAEHSSWVGVLCSNGIIIGLHLPHMSLSGDIDVESLRQAPGIRTLSFINNSFSGPIPNFNRLVMLRALYLTHNRFSGNISGDFFTGMASLKKLWLANNNFSGPIPPSVMKLPRLIELHLEGNEFSGAIPPAPEKHILTSLDLSYNKLEGPVPPTLRNFSSDSFQANAELCGEPVGEACKPEAVGIGDSSSSTSSEAGKNNNEPAPASEQKGKSITSKVVFGVISVIAVIAAVFAIATLIAARKKDDSFTRLERESLRSDPAPDDVSVGSSVTHSSRRSVDSTTRLKSRSSSRKVAANGKNGGMGDLVIINDQRGDFGLTDLMKAAAEVLGNGGLGSAYKAVMANGITVVVKRLRDMNKLGKDGFELEIHHMGKLRHQNILTPLAYHFRKEEKLLVSEYVPKGSLLYVLHAGDRGICHEDLTWPTRMKIIVGIVRGLGFLYSKFPSYDLPHGNLKSSNVLLDSNYEPLLADYAFHPLTNPVPAVQSMFAFRTPEAILCQQVSQKSDIYCFGVVLLEVLSGKFPSQYLSNGTGGTDVVQWAKSAIAERTELEFIDPDIVNPKSETNPSSSLEQMQQILHIGAAWKCRLLGYWSSNLLTHAITRNSNGSKSKE